MNFPDRRGQRVLLFFITALLPVLLNGCSGKRWGEPLAVEEHDQVAAVITAIQQAQSNCPEGFDGEIQLFWEGPLNDQAVEGYLQILSPSYLKVIISNPLGQAIYAFASDGTTYQILQPEKFSHIRGGIRSLAIRKEIPRILISGEWFAYLSRRLPLGPIEFQEIYRDGSEETVWFPVTATGPAEPLGRVWAHLDLKKRVILGYLFLDGNGSTVAELTYNESLPGGGHCRPPEELRITGLPWGAQLKIQLKDMRSTPLSGDDFALPVPPQYTTQLQP